MADATDTTPNEPTEEEVNAEGLTLNADTPAEPEDLPLPDYAEDAVQAVRAAAAALTEAEDAQAKRGRMVDKGEADRQTARLQARSLHALVELVVGGALTPPVAELTAYTFEQVGTADPAADGNEEEPDAKPEDTTAKKARKS